MSRTSLLLILLLLLLCPSGLMASGPESYLPLETGNKWVMRHPLTRKTITIEVVGETAAGYRIRSTFPGGVTDWVTQPASGKLPMIAYAAVGGPQSTPVTIPDKPTFLDFTLAAGKEWSNSLGRFVVESTSATVNTTGNSYTDCIRIRQYASGSSQTMSFAAGIGYVAYGDGRSRYTLVESLSVLPKPALTGLVGITPSKYAYEANTATVLTQRFQQTVQAGVTLLVGSGEWASLEPSTQQYSLDSVRYLVETARLNDLTVHYSIRVINTVDRDVPADLRTADWGSSSMRSRLLALIDKVAPILGAQTRWITIGYEVDSYFRARPSELAAFVELYQAAKARIKQILPDVNVSVTLTQRGVDELSSQLATLDPQLDYLAVNYSPLLADFTAAAPNTASADLSRMRQAAAGRKVVLQEIAYPSGAESRSTQAMQADFFRFAFQTFRQYPDTFAAANVMVLADLSDEETQMLANYYGLNTTAFRSTLQTLGLHDGQGNPKQAWQVVRDVASQR